MITITDSSQCCLCASCAQRCPKHCISIDETGILYVDKNNCVNCSVCESVCPILNKVKNIFKKKAYITKNPNDKIRLKSSSGGVFSMISENVIQRGGVVFGAAWDEDWNVKIISAETIEESAKLRGSKYVQANVGNSYKEAEFFLKLGREVVFSGTPCQIAGLSKFLKREYDNLIKVECVCHSIPQSAYWVMYLDDFLIRRHKTHADIVSIDFRDKRTGWKGYSVSIKFNDGTEYSMNREKDIWMKGFIQGLTTMDVCSHCPAKGDYSCADITIGDFWGVSKLVPDIDDDKGLSVVVEQTAKGKAILQRANVELIREFNINELALHNPAILYSIKFSNNRRVFRKKIEAGSNIVQTIDKLTSTHFSSRVISFLSKIKKGIKK